jgi:hypothetical protein
VEAGSGAQGDADVIPSEGLMRERLGSPPSGSLPAGRVLVDTFEAVATGSADPMAVELVA